jgi:hypothetical protein
LKAAGFDRAQWRKPMVSTWNDGFDTELNWTGDVVHVTWLFAGHFRLHTAEEKLTITMKLAAAAEVLAKHGYIVTFKTAENPYLEISKAAA